MSEGFISPILEWIGGIIILLTNVLIYGHRRRMEKIETNQMADHDDLAKFKLEASNTYARELSLKRIYDITDEMRNDIKQILSKI